MKTLVTLLTLVLSVSSFATPGGDRGPATDCDEGVVAEIGRLLGDDEQRLIRLQSEVTVLKLAAHLSPGQRNLEQVVSAAQTRLQSAMANDNQNILPRLREIYGLHANAREAEILQNRTDDDLGRVNYARASTRLQNDGAASYMIRMQAVNGSSSPFDSMDVAVAWALQEMTDRLESSGKGRGTAEHNLALLSVRVAQQVQRNQSPQAVEAARSQASEEIADIYDDLSEALSAAFPQCFQGAQALTEAKLKQLVSQFLLFRAPQITNCSDPAAQVAAPSVSADNQIAASAPQGQAPARDGLVDDSAAIDVRSCRPMRQDNGQPVPVIGARTPQQCAFQSVGFGPMPMVEGYSFYTRDQAGQGSTLPGRSWNVDFMDRARQQMSLTVQDFHPENTRYSENYSSTFYLFPRRQVPQMIPNPAGGYTLVLATGERVNYGAGGEIQAGSALSEGSLSTARRNPAVSYSGTGVSVRFNQDGAFKHPTDGNGVVEITKNGQRCRSTIRKNDLLTSGEWRAFRFPTDDGFNAFLQERCGFGI